MHHFTIELISFNYNIRSLEPSRTRNVCKENGPRKMTGKIIPYEYLIINPIGTINFGFQIKDVTSSY